MEFELHPEGRSPLPAPGVDTGMGLERLASVVQQVPSNYDTDLFAPIHARMRELLGHDPDAFEAERFSYQVIADHSRAVTFLIADGVLPVERGARLRPAPDPAARRPPRPAARADASRSWRDGEGRHRHHGEPTPTCASGATRSSAHRAGGGPVRRTLEAGTDQLEEALSRADLRGARDRPARRRTCPADAPVLPGEVAFRLHDTYGFPIDLTVELAAEYGVRVDRDGFERALAEQRDRSRSGTKARAGAATPRLRRCTDRSRAGPATPSSSATRRRPRRAGSSRSSATASEYEELDRRRATAELVLDRTPFYAEGGGQVGDRGAIREPGGGIDCSRSRTPRSRSAG